MTGLWVVGMINSINFIDGLDGLSAGVALIAALTLGIISLTSGVGSYAPMVALLCAALAGALAGFLPWNFHPARVFIGTTGVMAVGYALAVLSILGTAKVAVALLVLGVPIIDTFWIITRRLASRRSPFTPDRGHIHHRLLDLGLTHRGAVLLIYAICAALAVMSIVLAGGSGPLYAFLAVVVASGSAPAPRHVPQRGGRGTGGELLSRWRGGAVIRRGARRWSWRHRPRWPQQPSSCGHGLPAMRGSHRAARSCCYTLAARDERPDER